MPFYIVHNATGRYVAQEPAADGRGQYTRQRARAAQFATMHEAERRRQPGERVHRDDTPQRPTSTEPLPPDGGDFYGWDRASV